MFWYYIICYISEDNENDDMVSIDPESSQAPETTASDNESPTVEVETTQSGMTTKAPRILVTTKATHPPTTVGTTEAVTMASKTMSDDRKYYLCIFLQSA